MTAGSATGPGQGYARLAGFLYLAVMAAFVAPFVVFTQLASPEGFAQTALNVTAAASLYRMAITVMSAGVVGVAVLAWALYMLLKTIDPAFALFALLCRLAEAVAMGGAVAVRFAMLENYAGATDAASAAARAATHRLLLQDMGAATYIGFVFLAIGSAIFFSLLFRARFIPRVMSAFGVAASLVLGALAVTKMAAPALVRDVEMFAMLPMAAAEVGTGFWLLIRGVNVARWRAGRRAGDR